MFSNDFRFVEFELIFSTFLKLPLVSTIICINEKIAVIPARLHSTRFPKKILYPIDNKPMVAHVFDQAKKAKSLDDV
ncbi:MAG: hypothetical protein CM1200mP1_02810 [Candidatus Neomarinimicrobiota bacterium]|nr:MAG: hypothetical protein CM1200mP1_02810 [Candidatus Neomarinimicrobiota bacterium]